MNPLQANLQLLYQNLAALREREAKYGGEAPLALLNEIADLEAAIALTEQALRGDLSPAELRAELARLNIDHARMEIPAMNPDPSPLPAYQIQRLRDIEHHIQQRLELLREYETALELEDDPRRIKRYQYNIEREKESLAQYRRETAELGSSPGPTAPPISETVQASLAAMSRQIEALSQQVAAAEARLAAGQQTLAADLTRQQQTILAHIDQARQSVVAAVVQRLDANQGELVELLLDAADQQQIARWEADELTRLVQQSLLELRRLHAHRPDAGQWQRLLELLEQDVGWEQKLRLTLPLVPGLIEFESEVQVDVMGVLNETWRRLLAKIGR